MDTRHKPVVLVQPPRRQLTRRTPGLHSRHRGSGLSSARSCLWQILSYSSAFTHKLSPWCPGWHPGLERPGKKNNKQPRELSKPTSCWHTALPLHRVEKDTGDVWAARRLTVTPCIDHNAGIPWLGHVLCSNLSRLTSSHQSPFLSVLCRAPDGVKHPDALFPLRI